MGIAFLAAINFLDRAQHFADRRSRINAALRALDQGLSELKDAETGQRGFLLTGQPEYLAPYERGRKQALATFQAFNGLEAVRGLSPEDLRDLTSLTTAKLDELAETVRLTQEGRADEARSIVVSGTGIRIMDRIRALRDTLAGALTRRRDLDEEKLKTSRHRVKLALLILGSLGMASLIYSGWSMHREIRLRTASERRFRNLAELSPLGVYELEFERKTIYINDAHCRLAGIPREEATRERLRAAVHAEDRPGVIERVEGAMRDGLAFDQTYRLLHADGTTVWVRSLGTPIKDSTDPINGYLVISQDITAMRAAEAEILARAEALHSANKELEAFTYSVSHDLRAPLRHMDGFVGLLRRELGESLEARARHYLDVISASARQMGTLVDDLLAFSRLGRAEVRKTDFDLAALMRRVIDELAPDTRGRGIQWRVGLLPSVHGDPNLLRLALLNLLGNAVKFTRGRSDALIEISARQGPVATTVTIRDNGVGFDMQYADKLFGVFQRLHRQEEFEGTGIGLANVARIIHKHGGTVSAEGAVDGGAAFTFSLPTPEAP